MNQVMLVKLKFEESVSANDHIDNNNSFILLVVCGDTEKKQHYMTLQNLHVIGSL